ncbi:NAD-dependent epimerase/dehydratase family protein [Geobacter sulfurreducens]|jgi:dihydroflavonol-4-reductase|uniref:NAD-dependent nucleoside diphosphate-sugar epimerase/dehydratase n=1 Tax=Geobacter sulfurreducens (strain ATCC 51573 / DSM 12127 / PCA) TaxID=243231 RepID=Q74FC2_GEOSL|nr:hopanoid-associated sugar epimerase [Geobacter sulfurreducens]AAR34017.1 NAD-dependent nucleoside diphosphate-sugar epimerase/dehydratase [Geobacter sulfurreducens PCA]ADI83524.1 NAD-dependent nucleoside diphosphate-sugar epimerase/dehydratase [Geobacter sulfurreducens KN400]AJY70434.1 NAD-dependent dehydratase [Geobacter sulfurreducens]QVW35943.1 NAD-dependent epimerase/dehydratase family protein [Geobacter sulfurreducens]UAC04749.1 NAD-dependent epimerase/dehydratase family protein [Geoba
MKVFVTGATGFIGASIVRELLKDGCHVRVLARPGSDRRNLAGLDVEICEGDLRDRQALEHGLAGCEVLYHAAADYRLWTRTPAAMYAANVDGTRNILEAALRRGIARVVYTSSVGTLGNPGNGTPGTETTPVTFADMVGHYKKSKFLAEREAEAFIARGLPLVIVNPSTPVGPHDVKPTPTGKIIVDFLNRKMPAYLDTGLNIIDVEDCARGHLLAARHGRIGEKYILGHENLTLREIFALLARLTGIPAPRVRLPHTPILMAAYVNEALAKLTGKEPLIPLAGVQMAKKFMFFESSKATGELGLQRRPAVDALRRAVEWFRANGYAR